MGRESGGHAAKLGPFSVSCMLGSPGDKSRILELVEDDIEALRSERKSDLRADWKKNPDVKPLRGDRVAMSKSK